MSRIAAPAAGSKRRGEASVGLDDAERQSAKCSPTSKRRRSCAQLENFARIGLIAAREDEKCPIYRGKIATNRDGERDNLGRPDQVSARAETI